MHEVLPRQNGPSGTGAPVRIVRGGDVAAVRRSFPDGAIVAVVESTAAADAIAARLAGADVVLPCADPAAPPPADLAAACGAARALAHRAALGRAETRRAAHDSAGTASAVGLAAQLLRGAGGDPRTERRAGQLQELASRGAELAWRAARAGRSGTSPMEEVDVTATVRAFCRAAADDPVPPVLRGTPGARTALVDRVRLAEVLGQLVDNARRAGAGSIAVDVAERAGTVEVTVADDGRGLPAGWPAGAALEPFTSGWPRRSDGLGLCEAAEFAADHGGGLRVADREDGPGAAAVLTLPLLDERVDSAASGRPDTEWAVARILEGIARRVPLVESLEALVAAMEEHLPGSHCSILLLDPADDTLHHGAGARLPEPYRRAIDGLRIGPGVGSCGTAAFTRDEVIARDIATDARWDGYRELALPHLLRSCWSTPILDVDRGVVLGTFAVYHATPWTPGPVATGLVQRLTHVAAVAISTAGLHARLVESEARFRSVFETTGMGIALVDLDGRIVQANGALAAMVDRPVDGGVLVDLLDPADADAVTAAMAGALAPRDGDRDDSDDGDDGDGRTFRHAEVRLRRTGADEPLWAALRGSVVRDEQARYCCVELFDLTERRRVARARREAAVAETANRARSELLTLVSHELRTPLHAVIGFAQVLQSMPLSAEQQRESVGHILGAGRHLLQLINDLLDLTGAESGQLHLDTARVATGGVVAEALEIVAVLARERSITLVGPELDPGHRVLADPQRLRQVLLNLLGNAIKFTPAGGRVTVALRPGGISVTDTGPGITADEVPHLFTPFHRSAVAGSDGSGLGLALSQRLTTAMRGRLRVRSRPGAGSTFCVELPAVDPPAAPLRSGRVPAAARRRALTRNPVPGPALP